MVMTGFPEGGRGLSCTSHLALPLSPRPHPQPHVSSDLEPQGLAAISLVRVSRSPYGQGSVGLQTHPLGPLVTTVVPHSGLLPGPAGPLRRAGRGLQGTGCCHCQQGQLVDLGEPGPVPPPQGCCDPSGPGCAGSAGWHSAALPLGVGWDLSRSFWGAQLTPHGWHQDDTDAWPQAGTGWEVTHLPLCPHFTQALGPSHSVWPGL